MKIFENVTLAECSKCLNIHKINKGNTEKYFNYKLKGKLRLDEKLKQNKFLFKQPDSFALHGVLELDYNESGLFLFFTYDPKPIIIAYFEFEWYALENWNEKITDIKNNTWVSGNYKTIFEGKKSYIINSESEFSFSLSGQVSLALSDHEITLVEHVYEDNLFFSFFKNKTHIESYRLNPFGKIEISDSEITHYSYKHKCHNCARENNIISYPFSTSYTCICGQSYYFKKDGNVQKGKKFNKYSTPFIKLGTKCNFDGAEFEVIGHIEKKDNQHYCWNEFTLWNPIKGFCFLSVYEGHWIFLEIEKLKKHIPFNKNYLNKHINEGDIEYTIFNDYKSSINNCQGIFVGNILNDKNYAGIEYIAPPRMWAFEKPINESITAFKGRHVNGKALKKAFNSHIDLPLKQGIGAIEKLAGTLSTRVMYVNFVLGFLLLLLVQVFTMMQKREKIVFEKNSYASNLDETRLVTPPFKLEKSHNTLAFKLNGDVVNSWLENEVEIINLENGNTINFNQGVEYYSGYDSDGSWSEGSQSSKKIISFLPKGTYQISFTPSNENTNQTIPYSITVLNDVTNYRNFWIVILFIGVPCVFFAIYNNNMESQRWENSKFSP